MKRRVFIAIICFAFSTASYAQVYGKITDVDGNPVDYVSIKCKHTTLGTITDSSGAFEIASSIGDTLLIFHLNYNNEQVAINSHQLKIYLEKKTQQLESIEVSARYGFQLFDKCVENTYIKLRDHYLSRAYWNGLDIINGDTLYNVDIDFDIEQKKLNKLGREANIKAYKVEERQLVDSELSENDWNLNFQVRVKPPENNFLIYRNFTDEYVCLVDEDSLRYKLYFYPKTSVDKGYNNIEVAVHKKNLCIDYLASCTANNKLKYTKVGKVSGSTIKQQKILIYIKYKYTDEYCYLSYFEMAKKFNYSKDGQGIKRTHSSRYQVYKPDVITNNRRDGKSILAYNILESASDNHKNNFWSVTNLANKKGFNYELLSNANQLHFQK